MQMWRGMVEINTGWQAGCRRGKAVMKLKQEPWLEAAPVSLTMYENHKSFWILQNHVIIL
jgi:uncharacterized protein YbdZ (MbtH family)